jgi:hypothetical protein
MKRKTRYALVGVGDRSTMYSNALTGIAANHSMIRGQPTQLKHLIHGLDEPDYPPMPSPNDPIPLPHGENSMPEWFTKGYAQKTDKKC